MNARQARRALELLEMVESDYTVAAPSHENMIYIEIPRATLEKVSKFLRRVKGCTHKKSEPCYSPDVRLFKNQ